ncbi:MAG: exodeoxyribonuclease VII large subunit [Acidimicrobiales bacterium]|jgi:exodeoxyribonuclease VII large subunit|nr:exodeoxyribonuclease VII large subunit [Acidimicrobiales bacterium]
MPERTFTVVELAAAVAEVVEGRFGSGLWVEGEVASMSRSRQGHVYFDLVDRPPEGGAPVAAIPTVLWSSARERVNALLRRHDSIRIVDGVRIRIGGRIEFYPPKGRLQLQMQQIDPTYTLGLLAGERDRVVRLLEAEGLLHRNRGLVLGLSPRRVGLVTAARSAAEADVLQTLRDSGLAWEVVHVDTRVQGVGAEREVAAALHTVVRHDVDVVALVRGGGARTDLAVFDHELVARTIAGLPVPVITGIGHETDQSVADLVAHRSERTPTACAHALVEHVRSGAARAEQAWTGIARLATATLDRADADADGRARRAARAGRARIDLAEHRLADDQRRLRRRAADATSSGAARLERRAGRVAAASRAHLRVHDQRMARAVTDLRAGGARALLGAEHRVELQAARAAALDPGRALARGWTITRTVTGAVVRGTIDVSPGDRIVTTVRDGTITSVVEAGPEPRTESDADAR